MSEIRAHNGVPTAAQFFGLGAPTACAPLLVDSNTGYIYALATGDVVVGSALSGSVISVAQTFTGGLISVAGSPITTTGTLALTVAGTSGGVPYFSAATTWASSAALAANGIVLGGGAGAAPATNAGLTFNTTGDILTAGAINVAGTTAPTSGWYLPSADLIRTPNSVTIDDQLVVSGAGPHAIGGASSTAVSLFVQGSFTPASGGTGYGFSVNQTLSPGADRDCYLHYFSGTINEAGSGTHVNFDGTRFVEPSIVAGAAAVTNASTVRITAAPSGATNNYAFWIDAGSFRLDGTDGVGVGAGTLLTAPSAGDPDKWIPINSDGTQYWIPAWSA